MIARILVGLAGHAGTEPKLRLAMDIAMAQGATVTVMPIVDRRAIAHVGPVPLGGAAYAERLVSHRLIEAQKAAEAAIDRFEDEAQRNHVPLDVIRPERDPIDHLIAAWREHDLCVLGLRHWFGEAGIPDPDRTIARLIERGVRPILVAAPGNRPVRKVVVAYNGSMESAKAMKQFALFQCWADAEIDVVCVGKAKTGEEPIPMLKRSADYLSIHGYRARPVHLSDGNGAEALLDYTRDSRADLIVSGSSFRRILMAQRLGRNARLMIQSSEVPLFLSH